MELNEKQFITGFNSDYLLSEHEPQMLTALLKNIQPVNSYITRMSFGFSGGAFEYLDRLPLSATRFAPIDRYC